MTDLVDHLLGIAPGDPLDAVRDLRAQAREHTQRSYQVLLTPADPGAVSLRERFAIATFTLELHLGPQPSRADVPGPVRALGDHYRHGLTAPAAAGGAGAGGSGSEADDAGGPDSGGSGAASHGPEGVLEAVIEAAQTARTTGPYGAYRETGLTGESTSGPVFRIDEGATDLPARLRAALEHAHLLTYRPREAGAEDLQRLLDAGWSTDGIVTLSQLVSFLSYQVRLVHGLAVLGEVDHVAPAAPALLPAAGAGGDAGGAAPGDGERVRTYPEASRPEAFTRDEIGWLPWLEPLAQEQLTERHHHGLVDAARAKSDYFMVLARDPDALGARTRTDKDIFYNRNGGLPRAERELAATVASRVNGCVFCASVHARFAAHYAKQPDVVDRLLATGTGADLGQRWNTLTGAAAALTRTPVEFGPAHLRELRAEGLQDEEVADLISAAAFFNWANRLMLSLGQPQQ